MDHDFPVFVYGSLKRGQPNHRLLAQAEFLACGRTQPRFVLFDLGAYPALVRDSLAPLAVEGELYRVSGGLLAELDRFEDNGRLYRRELLPICRSDDDRLHEAWAYLYLRQLAGARRLPMACWTFQ